MPDISQKFNRTIEELEQHAVKWWPKELEAQVAAASPIPKLVETQDQFLSILKLSGNNPLQIFKVLESSEMPVNLFLKHLTILTDFGGELLIRLNREFSNIFPNEGGKSYMEFVFLEQEHKYEFKILPIVSLNNPKLKIDGASILVPAEINDLYRDVIMVLLYGSTSTSADLGSLERCELGSFLGDKGSIEKYVRERYLYVSRITGGSNANSLGQIAQRYVASVLKDVLPKDYQVKSGTISGFPFDVVVERRGKKVGIEVSFQVTTNSTIERKAGQSDDRKAVLERDGHWLAYVIDGAGNFQRSSAVGRICRNSHCTFAYSKQDLETLAVFIRGKLND